MQWLCLMGLIIFLKPSGWSKGNSPMILSVQCFHSTWNCIQVSISNAWHNILLMTKGHTVKWERLTYIRKLTDSKLLSVSKYVILSWGDGSVEKVFAEQPHRLKCEFQHPPKIQTGYEVERGRSQSVSSNSQLWPNRCYLRNTVGSDRRIPSHQPLTTYWGMLENTNTHAQACALVHVLYRIFGVDGDWT